MRALHRWAYDETRIRNAEGFPKSVRRNTRKAEREGEESHTVLVLVIKSSDAQKVQNFTELETIQWGKDSAVLIVWRSLVNGINQINCRCFSKGLWYGRVWFLNRVSLCSKQIICSGRVQRVLLQTDFSRGHRVSSAVRIHLSLFSIICSRSLIHVCSLVLLRQWLRSSEVRRAEKRRTRNCTRAISPCITPCSHPCVRVLRVHRRSILLFNNLFTYAWLFIEQVFSHDSSRESCSALHLSLSLWMDFDLKGPISEHLWFMHDQKSIHPPLIRKKRTWFLRFVSFPSDVGDRRHAQTNWRWHARTILMCVIKTLDVQYNDVKRFYLKVHYSIRCLL